jgi:hypothetical protein
LDRARKILHVLSGGRKVLKVNIPEFTGLSERFISEIRRIFELEILFSLVVNGFSISLFLTTHRIQLSQPFLVSVPHLFSSLLQQLFSFFFEQHFMSFFVSCCDVQTQFMHSDANVVAQNTTSAIITTAFEKVRYLNFKFFTYTKIHIFQTQCQLSL